FCGFALPFAVTGLKRILRGQAVFEDEPRVQGPAGIRPRLGCFPCHQNRACDVIKAARRPSCVFFESGLGGDPLREHERPLKRKAQTIPKSRRNQRGFIQQFLERALQGAVAAALADRACSVGTMILRSWRRSRGYSIMVLPNATRLRAQTMASLTQRRIIAAARTPCDSRDRLTCSIICLKPRSASPTR